MTTTKLLDSIDVGTKVYHGSPYYENLETISEIYTIDSELTQIVFESGAFTTVRNDSEFDENGECTYWRYFQIGQEDKALEVIYLAA